MLTLFTLTAVTNFSGSDGSNPFIHKSAQGSPNRRACVKLKQAEKTFKL